MLSALQLIAAFALLSPQTISLVSVDSAGVQGNHMSRDQAISANGRFVAFYSIATNLTPGDSNAAGDIFVRDLQSNVTTRVSVGAAGVQANAVSGRMAISGDGRYVAFEGLASNLVPGDSNGEPDVFVHDRHSAQTIRASVSWFGGDAAGRSLEPSFSADGRYLAFASTAPDLIAFDSNDSVDVFVRDLQSGTTERVSIDVNGLEGNGHSKDPSISDDGRFVAFSSFCATLVPTDFNGLEDVFVHDRLTDVTTRVSVDSAGVEGDGVSYQPALSGDGRFVAFTSYANQLTPGVTSFTVNIFVHDRLTGATSLVSRTPAGASGLGWSSSPTISRDGRFIAFVSDANDLLPGDNGIADDVFLFDRLSAGMARLTVSPWGAQTGYPAHRPSVSADGGRVVFDCSSNALVLGDTNNITDVFVCETSPAPTAYCTGATTTNGCTPSIAGFGMPSASASSGFTIAVSTADGQRSGLFFYGVSGPVALSWAPGSTSYMCVKGPTQRTPLQSTGGTFAACDGVLALDFLAFVSANPGALGQPLAAGARIDAQAWMRDPPAPKASNLSDALKFDVTP